MELPTSSTKVQKGRTWEKKLQFQGCHVHHKNQASGHAVFRSWCLECFARKGHASARGSWRRRQLREVQPKNGASAGGKGSANADACRNGCRKQGARRLRHQFHFSVSRGFWGLKRLITRSYNEPSLLALFARVAVNLQGIEMVSKTSPEGNDAAQVAVRGLKRQTREVRSQLEVRLGGRLEKTDP